MDAVSPVRCRFACFDSCFLQSLSDLDAGWLGLGTEGLGIVGSKAPMSRAWWQWQPRCRQHRLCVPE